MIKKLKNHWKEKIAPRVEGLFPNNIPLEKKRELLLSDLETRDQVPPQLEEFTDLDRNEQKRLLKKVFSEKESKRSSLKRQLIKLGEEEPELRKHIFTFIRSVEA